MKKQKSLLRDILSRVQVGNETHRVALLQFAGYKIQKTEWTYNSFADSPTLMRAIDNIRYLTGTTFIGAALNSARQILEQRRKGIPSLVILLSDGELLCCFESSWMTTHYANTSTNQINMFCRILTRQRCASGWTNTSFEQQWILCSECQHVEQHALFGTISWDATRLFRLGDRRPQALDFEPPALSILISAATNN